MGIGTYPQVYLGVDRDRELDAIFFGQRRYGINGVAESSAYVERRIHHLELASLYFRKIEYVVYKRQKVAPAVFKAVYHFFLFYAQQGTVEKV